MDVSELNFFMMDLDLPRGTCQVVRQGGGGAGRKDRERGAGNRSDTVGCTAELDMDERWTQNARHISRRTQDGLGSSGTGEDGPCGRGCLPLHTHSRRVAGVR
jgi:hypothetical protein